MNQLFAVLRLRPVLVTLTGIALSLITYFLLWPAFVSGDKDRRGALAIAALLALWAICEWGYLALKHYREQRTRPGQLRQLFNGALRHLEREHHGGGWMNADSLRLRPWLILLGTAESGTARLLERAGFRRIVSCTPPGEAPLCTFWLSQDSAGGSVCIEVSGSALIDTEGCEQLYRWIRRLRGAPDAVLLQVALQEIWSSDEERARAVAVQLSPALHTLLRDCPGELPIHVICNQLARVEGMSRYFGSAERRPWGFRLDRPLHSEFQASLVHERAQAIVSALWQRVNLTLVGSSLEASEVEALLDFPREMRRMSVLLGAFITKLCESFSADTRARLYEVFFANAEAGTPFEAARHRRLPLSRPATAKSGTSAEESGSYFLQGLFVRIARLTTQEPVQRAPRQAVALWTATALCVLLMTLASTFYARRHRGQLALRRQAEALLSRLDQLTKLRPPDPQHTKTLQTDMASFLKVDHEIATAAERMERAKRLYAINTPLERSVEELQRTISEYGQCQAANHLIGPLLRYEPKDLSKQHVQPLYDPLHSLLDVGDGRRKQGRLVGTGPLATTDWFDALYAIALLQRRPSCKTTPQDAKWLTQYLHTLWKVDTEGVDRGLAKELETRMAGLLTSYLQERKVCSLLGDNVDRRPVGAAQRALSSSGGSVVQPGIDIAAALELELRIKSSSKDRTERGGYRPSALTYFSARDDVPADATRTGCQQIMAANAAEIRWLRCILPDEAAANLQDRGVGNNRLAAQYMSRIEAIWSSWLGRLSHKSRPPTGNLENDLAEFGTAVGSAMQDIPVLFRLLGVGELPKGESLEVCRQSLRSFAPFRWAVDSEDEQGGKHAELQAQWKDYSMELTALRDQLNLIGRPAKPPTAEEALRTVLVAIQSLQRAEQKRVSWLKTLRAALVANQGPASFQEALGQFAQQIQKLEAEILQALLRKGRRLVACQWSSLRQQWSDTLSAGGGAGQAGAEDPRGAALRALLIRFRDTTITPFETVPQLCEMHAFRLSESMGEDSGLVVNGGFCKRARELLSATGVPVAAKPATPEAVVAPPSIIPTPDGRCNGPSDSVLQTILDVPDLQSRFVCNISRRECLKSGPNSGTSGKVLLRVDWAGGGTSDAVSLGTLREFVAPPPPTRAGGHRVRSEIDPWRQESRHVVEVSAPTLCKGRTFRIYFDESVAGRMVSKSPWPDATQLESAGQLLLETSCR